MPTLLRRCSSSFPSFYVSNGGMRRMMHFFFVCKKKKSSALCALSALPTSVGLTWKPRENWLTLECTEKIKQRGKKKRTGNALTYSFASINAAPFPSVGVGKPAYWWLYRACGRHLARASRCPGNQVPSH